jgi:hypothetical protein
MAPVHWETCTMQAAYIVSDYARVECAASANEPSARGRRVRAAWCARQARIDAKSHDDSPPWRNVARRRGACVGAPCESQQPPERCRVRTSQNPRVHEHRGRPDPFTHVVARGMHRTRGRNQGGIEKMRHTFAGFCVAAMFACAGGAEAQARQHGRNTREERKETTAGGHDAATTATGCVERGSTPHSFVLWDRTRAGQAPAGIMVFAPGSVDLNPYVGQNVQVSGVMSRQGESEERGAAAATRIRVREVRRVAGSCTPGQPAAGSVVGASAATNAAAGAPGAAPASATTPPGDVTTTTTVSGSSGQTGVSGDALLDGLINFNIQQLLVSIQFVTNVQDTVINVTDVLNDFQIQALLQLLNSNPVASLNATELSLALQQSGMLAPGETVVGVAPPTIRDNKGLTAALQEQGILRPGERVVGAKGERVYKMHR